MKNNKRLLPVEIVQSGHTDTDFIILVPYLSIDDEVTCCSLRVDESMLIDPTEGEVAE